MSEVVVTPDPNVVIFDYPHWMACFPEFAAVTQPRAQMFFNTATMFCDNTPCSPVPAQEPRCSYLDLLTAHIAALNGGLTACGFITPGQGVGMVGRISSATEGSVSITSEYGSGGSGGPSEAWYSQTAYGALYWAATAQFRMFQYHIGPQPFPEANTYTGRLGHWRPW
jgi:hypothetical protein